MNLRILWFWLSLALCLVSLASIPAIPASTWKILTFGQQLVIVNQAASSLINVAIAYWLYMDKQEIEKLKKK